MARIPVKACVFDAYGTLFDFASAAAGCRDVLGDKTAAVTAMWRDKQLQYTWLRGVGGRRCHVWGITGGGRGRCRLNKWPCPRN
jgi:2-haloacid dehalogenase